jgi:hypothetical protein
VKVKCGEGAEDREDSEIFVCHHRGIPVCETHGWVVGADEAFAGKPEPVSRAAMHCGHCADEYHKGATTRHGWADPKMVQPTARP